MPAGREKSERRTCWSAAILGCEEGRAGGHREHLWSWEWRILWEMLYVGKKEAYGISTPPKE